MGTAPTADGRSSRHGAPRGDLDGITLPHRPPQIEFQLDPDASTP
jgi:hypothetical protein